MDHAALAQMLGLGDQHEDRVTPPEPMNMQALHEIAWAEEQMKKLNEEFNQRQEELSKLYENNIRAAYNKPSSAKFCTHTIHGHRLIMWVIAESNNAN